MKTPTLLGGAVQVVSVAPTPQLRAYARQLADRAERIRSGYVDPSEDNLLMVTSDGRKASVFNGPPLTWPASPYVTKLTPLADRVFRHYVESDEESGAQLVFCDMYTPREADADDLSYLRATDASTSADRFAQLGVYGRLKEMLVAQGVPPDEIAFAHDYLTPCKRAHLHSAVRSGVVRVCVGSTALIGMAVNVQDRLLALHNLDCPWRPDELEQRVKRGVRQGNRYGEVAVYVYVTEGSYDPVVWQIVEGKARWISQLMSGAAARREVEDIGAVVLTAGMAKAVALGDARVVEKIRLETELAALERRWQSWRSGRAVLRRGVEGLAERVERLRRRAERLREWAGLVLMGAELSLVRAIGDTLAVDIESMQEADAIVRTLWQHRVGRRDAVWVGIWHGFGLWLETADGASALSAYPAGLTPDGDGLSVTGIGFQASRPVSSLGQRLSRTALEAEAMAAESEAVRLETRLQSTGTELAQGWGGQIEANRLLAEYNRVCSGVTATESTPGLDPLLDRVTFRFG